MNVIKQKSIRQRGLLWEEIGHVYIYLEHQMIIRKPILWGIQDSARYKGMRSNNGNLVYGIYDLVAKITTHSILLFACHILNRGAILK